MVQNCMHPSLQVLFDVVKSNALRGTVIYSPVDVHRVVRIPVIFGVCRGPVCQVVTRLEWHVTFTTLNVPERCGSAKVCNQKDFETTDHAHQLHPWYQKVKCPSLHHL